MLTSNQEKIIDLSQKEYLSILEALGELYEQVFKGKVKWTKAEVLANFDSYIQAVLTFTAVENGKLGVAETQLLGKLNKWGNLFKNLDITLFDDCNFEIRNRLQIIAKEFLVNPPIFVNLTGAVDKKYDKKYTKLVLDGIIKLGFNISVLGGAENGIANVKVALKSLLEFIKTNGIKL